MTAMRTVAPAPPAVAGLELCPSCETWIRVRSADGNMVVHPRTGPRCPGSGQRSTVPHEVLTPTARYTVAGRLNAELVALTLRRAGEDDTVEILAAS